MTKRMKSWWKKHIWKKWALPALLLVIVLGSILAMWYGTRPVHVNLGRKVWVNILGSYYHTASCDFLSPESNKVMIGVALQAKLKPCPICRPGGSRTSWIAMRWEKITEDVNTQAALVAIVGSIVNVAMVVATARNVKHTRRAAEAANRNADYTREYVESSKQNVELTRWLVEEAQIQRLGSAIPVLSIEWARVPHSTYGEPVLAVKNQGPGIALNAYAELDVKTAKLCGLGLDATIGPLGPGQSHYFLGLKQSLVGIRKATIEMSYLDVHCRRFQTMASFDQSGPLSVTVNPPPTLTPPDKTS